MKSSPLVLSLLSVCLLGTTPAFSAPSKPMLLAQQFDQEEQIGINVYKQASPAVVTIGTGRGSGSGTFVAPDGLILTNEHVVRSARQGQVAVRTSDDKRYTGQVIAVDRNNDLALVRVTSQDRFPVVNLATSVGIQVGQRVFAIGSPFGLSGTFTTGILSRVTKDGDLQTDAAINPGNSGGPLLNSKGELIGVNKAILSPGDGGNIGIGFATSALDARPFIQQNQANAAINPSASVGSKTTNPTNNSANNSSATGPRLGVTLDDMMVIQDVQSGSLASTLGLQPGDRLLALNGRQLSDVDELVNYLDSRPPGMVLTVARNRRVANLRIEF